MDRSDLLADFREHLTGLHRSVSTVKNYVGNAGAFLRDMAVQDVFDVQRVSWQDIEGYIARANTSGKLKPSSVQVRVNAIKAFFRYLTKAGRLNTNPAVSLEWPRMGFQLPRTVLTEQEMLTLLAKPRTRTRTGTRDRAILELLYSSGIRLRELCGLDLADVDTAKGFLTVKVGKGDKDRLVPAGRMACRWVRKYLDRVRPKLAMDDSGDALFLGIRCGRRIHPVIVRLMVKACARKAGIPKTVTPHALRHACGSHLCRGGAGILSIKAILGHERVQTTQQYMQVVQDDLRRTIRECHPREIYARSGGHP